MTSVFVHGVPETAAVWGPLVSELSALGRDDVVCLAPPGFGSDLPAGFGATRLEYRDWLVGELEALEGPVDLVGHDWGGLHVVAVVMARPDLVGSWATDVLEHFEPDYVWHSLARTWQTPGAGEEQLAGMFGGSATDRTRQMVTFGMPDTIAGGVAEGQDDAMAKAILALYRSAVQPAMAEAGAELGSAASRPGLYVYADADAFGADLDVRRRAWERAGAGPVRFGGCNHWWAAQEPRRAAQVLTDFWRSVR